MGTIWVREFVGGLDTRRLPETSPGGTLLVAKDCHINRGGEIEQRADFVHLFTLPDASGVGLARGVKPTVFGAWPSRPPGIPSNVDYVSVTHPDFTQPARLVSATLFERKLLAVIEYSDDSTLLFFDGARVTDANAPPNLSGSDDPRAVFTIGRKAYVTAGPVLYFSAVADASDFGGTGAGFIDMSVWAEGSDELMALARYENRVAVFGRDTLQFWFVDPDPLLNAQIQVLENTGALATRAVTPFRGGDLVYLDRSGIRSLAARDSSRNAAPTDLGTPLDALLVEALASANRAQINRACMVVEPRDDRLWLSLGSKIYVFSYFPGSKISAWSIYEPGFRVDDMVRIGDQIWLRSGDDVYAYGGLDPRPQYSDAVQAEVWMPYLDADAPSRAKHFRSLDVACRGVWEIKVGFDPQNLDAVDEWGLIDGSTFTGEDHPALGSATHIGLRFKSMGAVSPTQPAVLGSVVIHHDLDDDEDSSK